MAGRTARAFSCGLIFFGMLLILLDSNRSGVKPGALQSVCLCLAGDTDPNEDEMNWV